MQKLFLIPLLFLSACGFSPLYQKVASEQEHVPVKIAPIPKQYGLIMYQVIQNKLGGDPDSTYLLTVSAPSFSSWDQTIDDKNFTTIMGISGSVSYTLTETGTNNVILNDSTSLTSSYSVVKDPYATTVAKRKVEKELSQQLAEQVSLHVLGTLAGVRH